MTMNAPRLTTPLTPRFNLHCAARFIRRFLVVAIVCFVGASSAVASDDWLPITPQELAMKSSLVEKDADAEAIFWTVRVADTAESGDVRNVVDNYIRIKIFNERGREAKSKIEIPYLSRNKIKDIAARTVKPDGSIVELDKKDVFETTVVKFGGIKIKAKSFALPAVEPGAIIEYKWREVRGDSLANYLRLDVQQDVPVQTVTYYLKPLVNPYFPYGMRVLSFNFRYKEFKKEKNGFYSTTINNVPAFREEPRMPPAADVRQWMLVYYSEDKKLSPQSYWHEHGKLIYSFYKNQIKPNDDVKAKAAELAGDAKTDDEKLARFYDFCRTNIKNVYSDTSGYTSEQIGKLKENKNAGDTLKRGYGTSKDVDILFASLATAAGFDARVATSGDRSDIRFRPDYADSYFLRTYNIAVRAKDAKTSDATASDAWKFYNPGSSYTSKGMLVWYEEGEVALVSDPEKPVFVMTPLSPPDKTVEARTARLTLAEDGTLEGDVEIRLSGHYAAIEKSSHDDETEAEREKNITEELKTNLFNGEITNLKIENITDAAKPVIFKFHVKLPGYAQRTGKRLFIQPSVFESTKAAMFLNSTRQHPIFFSHAWTEKDSVEIKLPAGFALDSPTAPSPLSAGEACKYDVKLSVTKDQRTLIFNRTFTFGGSGNLFFEQNNYANLKRLFDSINEQDKHTVALKSAPVVSVAND